MKSKFLKIIFISGAVCITIAVFTMVTPFFIWGQIKNAIKTCFEDMKHLIFTIYWYSCNFLIEKFSRFL